MAPEVLAAAIAGAVAAPLLSLVKKWFADKTEASIKIKMRTGETVTLDLDPRLGRDRASELVEEAVKSVQSGDASAVQKVVEVSHSESERARHSRARLASAGN